eukprot:365244-Chlamydomonas_euryale.AAC.17
MQPLLGPLQHGTMHAVMETYAWHIRWTGCVSTAISAAGWVFTRQFTSNNARGSRLVKFEMFLLKD